MTTTEIRTLHIFLTRGLIAIAWSAVFAATSYSLTTGVSVAAGILFVIYPLTDVAGTLLDARTQHATGRRVLLGNAARSAVALGVAATGTIANVLTVFGVWAFV